MLPNIIYARMYNASVFTLGLLFRRGFLVVDGLGRDREGILGPYVHFFIKARHSELGAEFSRTCVLSGRTQGRALPRTRARE